MASDALLAGLPIVALLATPSLARAGEWSGQAAVELRGFFSPGLFAGQPRGSASLALQPEYYHDWGSQSILAIPFVRLDSADPERSHADIRELAWRKVGGDWELLAGVGKVFWGVTESQHLVDVINQTDLVENLDGEDKLGQPMIDVTLYRSWGTLDLFVLPGFRERTFPGPDGRLSFPLRVATELSQYESSAEKHHVDFAARWSHTLGAWDLGLAHFYGTSREPLLLVGADDRGEPALIPRYDVIHQTSLDLQATLDGWLWKLELLGRSGQGNRFTALTGGFEYTFANLGPSGFDLGILLEYLFDDRGLTIQTPFEDDFFLGARLGLNDVQGTELLGGVIIDRESGASFFSLEASRRLSNRWKLSAEARAFAAIPEPDPFYFLRSEDYVQLELAWFF